MAQWTVASIVLAGGGFAVGWWLYDRRRDLVDSARIRFEPLHRLVERKYYLDDAYQWTIDQVVLKVSQGIAIFDRRAINDGAVNGTALSAMGAGRALRHHATGLFADYGVAMVIGVIGVGLFFWLRA